MAYANDWGTVYNKNIIPFTGRNKVAVRELEDVVKGTSAMVKSLVALDKTDPTKFQKDDEHKKAVKAFGDELKVYQKEAAKYAAIVDKALKATDKDIHPDAFRAVKLLKAELATLGARLEHQYTSHKVRSEERKLDEKLNDKQDKLRDKGLTDNEIIDKVYVVKVQKMLLTFGTNAKSALAKAALGIQKIKAAPTVQNYNTFLDPAGRALSQMAVNVVKMKEDEAAQKLKLVKQLPDVSPYRALLAKYGSNDAGNKRTLPPDASAQEIQACLKEFAGLVKAMAAAFDQVNKIKVK